MLANTTTKGDEPLPSHRQTATAGTETPDLEWDVPLVEEEAHLVLDLGCDQSLTLLHIGAARQISENLFGTYPTHG